MKILQVIDDLEIGGAETLLRDLTLGLSRKGHDVAILLLRSTGSFLEKELLSAGLRVVSLGTGSVYSPAYVWSIARFLRQDNFDVVHVHLFPAQLWVSLAALMTAKKTPLVTTEHSTYNRRRDNPLFRFLDAWMYEQYQLIIAISEAAAKDLCRWVPNSVSRIQVVPNGIDVPRFANARAESREALLGTNAPIILCVARFEPQKNQATLIRALTQVESAHLVLVGDGPTRLKHQQLAKDLGVEERTHFLGRRSDVPSLIKMADIYVQPSHWEGFGIATLEAMAGGIPVIASRVPGLMDVIGDAGLLFEPHNDEELASYLSAVLNNSQLRKELSNRSRGRAEAFSIDMMVTQYLTLYENVIESLREE